MTIRSTFKIGAALQLCSLTKIAPKSPFLCENRDPIRYGFRVGVILGDPGADSGGEGKSERAGKYSTKKSKERREEPLGTMSYPTSSKLSPSFWLLIGTRKLLCLSAQSEGRTAGTVWNCSGKTMSPGALLAVLYFSSCYIFPPV